MRDFFNLDSPFMQFLNGLTDVVILNVICLICCLPVVTIGASLTALHYVTLKMARNEAGYVVKDFFRAFKENIKQSTIIWIIFLIISAVFYLDYRILESGIIELPRLLEMVIYVLYLFVFLTVMYAFPLLSRFSNTTINTIKNAFFMSIIHVVKTIPMAIIYLLPFLLLPLHFMMIAVYMIIGISGPAYLNSYIWKGIFKKYEPAPEDDEIRD